jgi:glycosyltransferase involved in cell wall biosynthesis
MIRIAYIIDTIESPAAGTEQQLLMLLNNLDKNYFAPYLICLRDSEWFNKQSFTFPLFIYDLKKLASVKLWKFIDWFKELHKREQFDIVQTFFMDANIAGVIAARLAGVKTIVAGRRNSGDSLTSLQINVLRLLKRWTTNYLANAQAVAKTTAAMEEVNPGKIEVIYNGMNLERFASLTPELRARQRTDWGIADNEILIGLVANLRPVKNVEGLIKSASELTKEFNQLKFAVVGEGPHRGKLQTMINSAGMSERFHLVGRYNDVASCLAAFDIGVLCSKAEGFSNSLIEYMAAGLPVVASDVGGNSEAIQHNRTGLICNPADPAGLIQSLRQLIENEEQAKAMGVLARKTATAKYSVAAHIENHQKYYLKLIEKNAP